MKDCRMMEEMNPMVRKKEEIVQVVIVAVFPKNFVVVS